MTEAEADTLLRLGATDRRTTRLLTSLQPDIPCRACGSRVWCGGPHLEVACYAGHRHRLGASVTAQIARAAQGSRWRDDATEGIHFEPVWRFEAATENLRDAIIRRADPQDALNDVYDLAAHVRNMSRDDAWKSPTDAVRAGLWSLQGNELRLEDYAKVCEAMLAALPPTVEFEPLNYWPVSRTFFSGGARERPH